MHVVIVNFLCGKSPFDALGRTILDIYRIHSIYHHEGISCNKLNITLKMR
jgi:hypothetical protein